MNFNYLKKRYLLLFLTLMTLHFANSQTNELKRIGFWDISSKFIKDKGVLITRVGANGTFQKLSIKKGDILLSINGSSLAKNKSDLAHILNEIRGEDFININFLRNKKENNTKGIALGLRKEKNSNLNITYTSLDINKERFRVIIKEPKVKPANPLNLLYIPDFSCFSIESYKYNFTGKFLNSLSKKGVTVYLIEKHGLGDNISSKKCNEVTFKEEIELYKKAYEFILKENNKDNTFVFGLGIGSLIALDVGAEKNPPKGKILFGTNFRPWSDYLSDRIRYHGYLSRKDLSILESEFTDIKKVFNLFFKEQKDPDLINENLHYAKILSESLGYKPNEKEIMRRNYRYWQEVEKFPIPKKIKEMKSYSLSIHGGQDTENFLELDQKLLSELSNTYRPNFSQYIKIDSLNHYYGFTGDAYQTNAIDNTIRPYYSDKVVDLVYNWMSKTNEKSLNIKSIPAPRSISLVNIKELAFNIVGNAKTTNEKVTRIIGWANKNLKWVATDYNKRSSEEIISRGGGNCNEEAIVVLDLLNSLGIKAHKMKEINLQPDNERREKDAKRMITFRGNSFSVFGLRHNDHVWIEYYDEEQKNWQPADPTLNLIGFNQWLKARLGFSNRVTHEIIKSQDMIFPFFVSRLLDTNSQYIHKTNYYLIENFDKIYLNKLSKLPSWKKWKKGIKKISEKSQKAFAGKLNLHEYNDELLKLKTIYLNLKKEFESL